MARHRTGRTVSGTAIAVAAMLIAAAVSTPLVLHARDQHAGSGCRATLTVAAAPGIAPALRNLARDTDGGCAARVVSMPPSDVVAALARGWDERSDGPRPEVWVPDSPLWERMLDASGTDAHLLPDGEPAIATSPIVFAVPRPIATVLGASGGRLTWRDLSRLFFSPDTWTSAHHSEFGRVTMGVPDPARSTAGLAGLLGAVAAASGRTDAVPMSQYAETAVRLMLLRVGRVARPADGTDAFFTALRSASGAPSGARSLSAFWAQERDVWAYNAGRPALPLTALYPNEGTPYAEHHFVVLRARWVGDAQRRAAADLLRRLQAPAGRARLAADGFRVPSPGAGAPFLPANGLVADPPRAILGDTAGASAQELVALWHRAQKRFKALAVVDVSGSMAEPAPGQGESKLAFVSSVMSTLFGNLLPQDEIGLWEFATRLDGARDYKELVPIGPVGAPVDGTPRSERLVGAFRSLRPATDTGLYDTTLAAYRQAVASYDPAKINAVVLLTDGRNDDTRGTSDLPTAVARLQAIVDSQRPVKLICLAYGADADADALRAMSQVTGGRAFVVDTPAGLAGSMAAAFASY